MGRRFTIAVMALLLAGTPAKDGGAQSLKASYWEVECRRDAMQDKLRCAIRPIEFRLGHLSIELDADLHVIQIGPSSPQPETPSVIAIDDVPMTNQGRVKYSTLAPRAAIMEALQTGKQVRVSYIQSQALLGKPNEGKPIDLTIPLDGFAQVLAVAEKAIEEDRIRRKASSP